MNIVVPSDESLDLSSQRQWSIHRPPDWILVPPAPSHQGEEEQKDTPVYVPSGKLCEYSQQTTIDGLSMWLTIRSFQAIYFATREDACPFFVLRPPFPLPFFAMSRYRSLLTSIPSWDESQMQQAQVQEGAEAYQSQDEWLFTTIGYLLPDSNLRVYVTILPNHIEFHTESRDLPFTFV